jgi:hypothetical protein
LDIYIPDLKIGIEYQGIQHYEPIEHWGGKSALDDLKERDVKKKRLCTANRVKLIYFDYTEAISSQSVAEKLEKYLRC